VLLLLLLFQVNDRIQLTDEQVLQLQLAHQRFLRLLGNSQHKQQQIIQALAGSSSLREQQQQRQAFSDLRTASALQNTGRRASASSSSGGSGEACHTPAAAAAAVMAGINNSVTNMELLEKLLVQHTAGWTAAAGLLLQFYCNTLTQLQIARMLIASYPFMPCCECAEQQLVHAYWCLSMRSVSLLVCTCLLRAFPSCPAMGVLSSGCQKQLARPCLLASFHFARALFPCLLHTCVIARFLIMPLSGCAEQRLTMSGFAVTACLSAAALLHCSKHTTLHVCAACFVACCLPALLCCCLYGQH
jgi:hypothetical protein